MTATSNGRIDWKAVRDTIDLAAVATKILGPAPGRRGEHGRKLWWSCPLGTHEDPNPSFSVEPGKPWWKCWGCGESGDAATLVMKVQNVSFPQATVILTGGSPSAGKLAPRPNTAAKPPAAPTGPEGMPEADALALVVDAERCLWRSSGYGPAALAYLHRRGLSDDTIRAARLGYADTLALPGRPRGITIPWLDGDRLVLLKIRQPDGRRPKVSRGLPRP
jgi:DNA primase